MTYTYHITDPYELEASKEMKINRHKENTKHEPIPEMLLFSRDHDYYHL